MRRVRKENLAGDIALERQIITGMILSDYFLREAVKIYKPESLSLPFAKEVAGWCVEYYGEFKVAPKQHIQDIYRRAKGQISEDSAAIVEEFLYSLSESFSKDERAFNDDYILKEAEEYFRLRSLSKLSEEIGKAISSGSPAKGEALIGKFHRVTRPLSVGVDPFKDFQYVRDAFEAEERESMFSLPGDLGHLIGPLYRGWFGMIVGAQGRGKTWWLIELTMRALLKGYNVFYLSMEMTEKQMIRRFYHWLTALPNARWAGDILLPTFDCAWNQEGECDKRERAWKGRLTVKGKELPDFDAATKSGYKMCTYCRGGEDFSPAVWYKRRQFQAIDWQKALRKAEDLSKTLLRGSRLKLLTAPAGTMSISDVRVALNNYEHYQGWLPDVFISDYSDKMAPDNKMEREYRHRLNDINVGHKSLALDRNILVFSASQTSKGRFDEQDIDSGDFAEDIRKRSELDIGWSLNQTSVEKRRGIMRVKVMKQRHDDYSALNYCTVLQQLKIGKPYLDSCINRGF